METIKIEAQLRTRYTKGDIKQARRRGRVPGAVFGKGIEPFLVEVSSRSIVDVLRSEGALNTLVELSIPGQPAKTAIIADLERDPITRGFLHVGFHNVAAGEKVHTQLPIRLIGMPSVVTQHLGLIDQTMESLDVRGESGSLPSHIDIDISNMEVGDKIHVSDLAKQANVEFLAHDDTAVVSILAVQRAEAIPESGDAAASTLPEAAPAA
jgi:large subunit ribosomal protein L25